MTSIDTDVKEKKRADAFKSIVISVTFTCFVFICAIFLSDELSAYVAHGLNLAIKVIIPSVFPFLILTDFAMRFISFEKIEFIKKAFERVFNINGCALPALVCGLICGFPVGSRLALTLYENEKISRDECERLTAFANNASPGYVICAVGIGMRGSVRDGILLYSSMVASSIICGFLIGINHKKSNLCGEISRQKYSFINSTKEAATICFNISGFVTVFSMVAGLLKKFVSNEYAFTILIPFLEMGNASSYLSDLKLISERYTLTLTAFAVSFSGLCVMAQVAALIGEKWNFSFTRHFEIKFLQGLLASLLISLFNIM